ncbi:MAG: (d)CMP kinase [Porphyromonadaceae bacterium]|nr:(d)CMP kinase [Porphyromonadaceae bacterium]
MNKIIVAIDGYSSCGKSTMAKELAREVGYIYVDTGAMYRGITLMALRHGFIGEAGQDNSAIVAMLSSVELSFRLNAEGVPCLYLGDECVEHEIRTMYVSSYVSAISAIPEVRSKVTDQLQAMGEEKCIVMDGRDIGTNVFPEAELKVFVTADPKVRAERRLLELRGKGDCTTTLQDVLTNIKERDHADTTREISPLKQAEDAIVLDNSFLSQEEQSRQLRELFDKTVARAN